MLFERILHVLHSDGADKGQLFPENFLWGCATAAHRVEGNNTNSDLWTMEHLPGSMFKEPSGDACDHYHLYRQDISMLADLGFNTYSRSIVGKKDLPPPKGAELTQAGMEFCPRCVEHVVRYASKETKVRPLS